MAGIDPGGEFTRLNAPMPLHKAVQAEIRQYITSRDLRPGDPLKPEAEMARQFGVSVTTVREAVKGLESTGVLETRRGAGVFVREFSFTPLLDHLPYGLMSDGGALRDLVAVRKALETSMIGDAMEALQPATMTQLNGCVAEMADRAATGQGVLEQDREFHRLLFSDLGNRMLLQLLDLFWEAYHRAASALPANHDPKAVHARHDLVLRAVRDGDVDGARDAMRRHYAGIEAKTAALPDRG